MTKTEMKHQVWHIWEENADGEAGKLVGNYASRELKDSVTAGLRFNDRPYLVTTEWVSYLSSCLWSERND